MSDITLIPDQYEIECTTNQSIALFTTENAETPDLNAETSPKLELANVDADPSKTLQLYLPIQKTDTVFTTILSNLYKDDEFQQNINRLEGGTEREKKKALIIKKTVSKIRVYGDAEQPLLLARDVGILMGISNIKLQLKFYNSAEKVIGLYQLNNGKTSQVEFLTWKGFIRVASNSRSILSDLFREFIYELVAEAIGDHSLLDKITKRVVEKNPELVNSALDALDQNADRYRLLYEREAQQRRLLEEGISNEIQQRLVAEQKQTDAELIAIMQDYKVKEMKKYIEHYEKTLLNLYEMPQTADLELQLLRRKYMRPVYIYAPQSKTYKEWLTKKDPAIVDFTQYIPEYTDRIEYIMQRSKDLVRGTSMAAVCKCILPESDYFYFYLHFGTPLANGISNGGAAITGSADDYVHIATEWVVDRRHYESVIEELNKESNGSKEYERIVIKKKAIYYCSLEEIRLIISQKLIESETQ